MLAYSSTDSQFIAMDTNREVAITGKNIKITADTKPK